MKRIFVFSFVVVVGACVFYFMRTGASSHPKAISAPSESQEQASTLPAKPSAAAASVTPSEVRFFNDSGQRNGVSDGIRHPQNTQRSAFPASAEELRPTTLWRDQTWQLWRGVKTVAAANFQTGSAEPLGFVGSYVLIKDDQFVGDEHQFSSQTPLPVYNSARNKTGLITGVFTLVLKTADDFENVVLDYDLNIKGAFPQLRTYYVAISKEPYDLVQAMEAFKKDSRIEKIDLEVVSANYGKK